MKQFSKYLAVIVGAPALVLLLAVTAMSVVVEQTGINGKQVYSYDQATGMARMQVVISDILVRLGGEHVDPTESLGYLRTVGGVARSFALMTDVTTDTSSATTTLPIGGKTFYSKIVGTGAQSVTVTIYGDYKSTATEEFEICVMSLSGTTEDSKKCTSTSEDYDYYHAKTTTILGTSATVNVWAMVGLGGGSGSGGAVTNAGTFAVQESGAALTALQLIDNLVADPCAGTTKTHISINISTATTTELTAALAGASTNYYVCSLDIVTAAANNVALVDDDTDNCASVTSGLAGGITAATGWNLGATGGLIKGGGGATVFKTAGANRVLCLMTSAATQLSGSIQVVAAP